MTLERYSEVLGRLISVVRATSSAYAQDVGFLRTMDPKFKSKSQQVSEQLLDLIDQILEKSGNRRLNLEAIADVNKNWPAIENAFDSLIDHTKDAKQSPVAASGAASAASTPTDSTQSTPRVVFYDKNIVKPQKKFSVPVDTSYGPFKPLLTDKPWATTTLNKSIAQQKADKDHQGPWFLQPYEEEIKKAAYPDLTYHASSKLRAPDVNKIEEKKLEHVADRSSLVKMIKDLKKENLIAIDLEHHDYRSYMGIVCLMQISTTRKDYIVDTLVLRNDLQELNAVFCDPNTLKVLHGARMDILWLQRDLGLYIVGLFDTYYAARALGKPKHSLAYLLEHYCGFTADKKYQMADWRARPLSKEMLLYARADTHFLLYIFQQLRNELLERNLLGEVLDSSRAQAQKRYEKPEYNAEEPGWHSVAFKFRLNCNDHVLEALYRWRDGKARELDESPRFIFSNQTLAGLVNNPPRTLAQVYATNTSKEYAPEILEVVEAASKLPARPVMYAKPRRSAGASTTTFSGDLFNIVEVNAFRAKRLQDPTIFTEHPVATASTSINLEQIPGLVTAPVASENKASESGSESASESTSESTSESDSEPVPEPSPEKPRSNKRRINVIENVDELELKPVNKKKKAHTSQEAFDFGAAEPVLNTKNASTQHQRRQKATHKGGPKGGLKQRHAKNAARTVTYRK